MNAGPGLTVSNATLYFFSVKVTDSKLLLIEDKQNFMETLAGNIDGRMLSACDAHKRGRQFIRYIELNSAFLLPSYQAWCSTIATTALLREARRRPRSTMCAVSCSTSP